MEEKRELVFDEKIYENEKSRVKKFKAIIIISILIACIIVPLIEVRNYNQAKVKIQTYSNIAINMWNNGIEDIKYTKLEINILDDNIKYEDIYKMGINSIGFNKLEMSIYIDNSYWIIQKGNTIIIQSNGLGNIAKLKFNESDVEVINESIIKYILLSIFAIIILISSATIMIKIYVENGEIRMIKDMQKLSNSKDTIL